MANLHRNDVLDQEALADMEANRIDPPEPDDYRCPPNWAPPHITQRTKHIDYSEHRGWICGNCGSDHTIFTGTTDEAGRYCAYVECVKCTYCEPA